MRSGGSSEDREYSFFDGTFSIKLPPIGSNCLTVRRSITNTPPDDLPVIRENVRQGFIQTQSTVNKWITDLRKRIDGEDEDDLTAAHLAGAQPQRQNYGASQTNQMRGIRKSAEAAATRQGRKSTEYERYDADPRVLSDNFSELELKDEGNNISTYCLSLLKTHKLIRVFLLLFRNRTTEAQPSARKPSSFSPGQFHIHHEPTAVRSRG